MDDFEDLSRRAARPQNQPDPAIVRPMPWYVGNGPRLIALVVMAVGLLTVLRVILLGQAAELAWAWAGEQPALLAMGMPPTYPLPHPPIPIDRNGWMRPEDNPMWHAAQRDPTIALLPQNRRSEVALRVDGRGVAVDCWPIGAAGTGTLSDTACAVLLRRARFVPGRNARGNAVTADTRIAVVWRYPTPAEWQLTLGDRIRSFDLSGSRVGMCRQWIEGRGQVVPECAMNPSLAAIAERVQRKGARRLIGRSNIVVSDTGEPRAFPPLPHDLTLIEQQQLRATIGSDGVLRDCSVSPAVRGYRPPTPCDWAQTVSKEVRPHAGVRRRLLIEDRVSTWARTT